MKSKRGFTLIELLIVIALLGALAVGLIGAIDPFEQLKKGADTGTRDIVNQVQTAAIRYYSVKNALPFADVSGVDLNNVAVAAGITAMVDAGELRSDFTTIQANNLSKVFVTSVANPPSVKVCYMPTSKSFQNDPNTKYTISGGIYGGNPLCLGQGGTAANTCYWCIQ
jgi:prepilin-type N-terminal cleavage/methylation domain-containing protein